MPIRDQFEVWQIALLTFTTAGIKSLWGSLKVFVVVSFITMERFPWEETEPKRNFYILAAGKHGKDRAPCS